MTSLKRESKALKWIVCGNQRSLTWTKFLGRRTRKVEITEYNHGSVLIRRKEKGVHGKYASRAWQLYSFAYPESEQHLYYTAFLCKYTLRFDVRIGRSVDGPWKLTGLCISTTDPEEGTEHATCICSQNKFKVWGLDWWNFNDWYYQRRIADIRQLFTYLAAGFLLLKRRNRKRQAD
jgi:hypothetical protein